MFAVSVADGPEALLISGTVGAGKTTAAEAVGDLLRAEGVPHAVIDLDELRRGWPSPPDDRFNLSIELANLAAVAANYLRAGAHRLVLAGVLEAAAARHRYKDAVAIPLHVARLRVDLSLARRRLRRRHAGHAAALEWHLHRVQELHTILEVAGADDFVIDTDVLTVEQIARALLVGAGWTSESAP